MLPIKNSITGFLLINKPKGITSFDCIRKIKKIIGAKEKIGHTGTLDPFATGLMIICIGKAATKRSSELMATKKEYLVSAKLGEQTDTLDCTGEVLETKTDFTITKDDISTAAAKLGSEYTQIPPAYSALKHKGKPLYKLARNKTLPEKDLEKILKEKARSAKIYNLEILSFEKPFFKFVVECSKGTYVRSLANDIANQIGLFATTYELTRTKIEKIKLDEAVPLEKINDLNDITTNLVGLENL